MVDSKIQDAARAGYEAAGGKLGGVEGARDVRAELAPDAATAPTERDPNAPPEAIDAEFHAKALYGVLSKTMRAKGHAPPEWNALPEATRGTWATAIATNPTK